VPFFSWRENGKQKSVLIGTVEKRPTEADAQRAVEHLHMKINALNPQLGNIDWHTFRHGYSTLLHALGAAPAVQKELLRHASIQTTMNIYTQAVTRAKREAGSKVVDVLLRM